MNADAFELLSYIRCTFFGMELIDDSEPETDEEDSTRVGTPESTEGGGALCDNCSDVRRK